jgi:hypothetical protein
MAVSGTGTACLNFTASNDQVSGVYVIDSMRWVGATVSSAVLRVESSAGALLFSSISDGPTFIDGWVFDRLYANGINVASMNSGTLQVYMAYRG